MATLSSLIDQTRNFLRDVPDYDQLTASLTNSATTITVADVTNYRARWTIEVDYETIMLRSVGTSGTSMTGTRAWRGSAAATHANGAGVFIRPAFYAQEIIDSLNNAVQAMFPYVYKPVVDTSLTVLSNQYQYVIPDMPGYTGYPIPMIYRLEVLQPGDYTYRPTRRYEVMRGFVTAGSPASSNSVASTYPIIKFRGLPPISGTIRIHGFGPFPPLVNLADTTDPLMPPSAVRLLPKIAAGYLLLSGEAGRDRSDTGPTDRREEANVAGSSARTGLQVLQRSDLELLRAASPPLPRHIKTPM